MARAIFFGGRTGFQPVQKITSFKKQKNRKNIAITNIRSGQVFNLSYKLQPRGNP